MAVEVEFHPETFAEFFAPVDESYPGLSARLKRDFERYVASDRNSRPTYFGRDTSYTWPEAAYQAQLMHIHIELPPGRFRQDVAPFYRVCRRGNPERDAALVYVQGMLEEDQYRILAFLWPDAHEKARDKAVMLYFARIAKEFRDTH